MRLIPAFAQRLVRAVRGRQAADESKRASAEIEAEQRDAELPEHVHRPRWRRRPSELTPRQRRHRKRRRHLERQRAARMHQGKRR